MIVGMQYGWGSHLCSVHSHVMASLALQCEAVRGSHFTNQFSARRKTPHSVSIYVFPRTSAVMVVMPKTERNSRHVTGLSLSPLSTTFINDQYIQDML